MYQIRSFSDIPERQTFHFAKEVNENGRTVLKNIQYNLVEYFRQEKQIELRYPKLRCLQCYFLHERHDPKHLPMEVCRIVAWQECEREVDHSATDTRCPSSSSLFLLVCQ